MTKLVKAASQCSAGVSEGIGKIFPVKAGTKEPAIKDWASEATDNPLQIEAWHIQFAGCSWAVACKPSGLGIVDVDPPIRGREALFAFELEHEQLPATREHRPARGGRHLIYSDPEHTLKNTASKLGPKLDTRGGGDSESGGYILIPPSTFDGKPYTVSEDRPLAPLPKFVADTAGAAHVRLAAPDGFETDDPFSITRADTLLDQYIKSGDVAIEDHGGDTRTYELGAELHDLGLSLEKALEVVTKPGGWNNHCQPPWQDDELCVVFGNAYRYAKNEAGAKAVPPVEQRIPAEALDKLKAESVAGHEAVPDAEPKIEYDKPRRLRFYSGAELIKLPSPHYRVKPWLITNSDGLLYAPKDHAKTFIGLDFCCSIAANIAALGAQYQVCAPGPAFYCLLEGGDTAKFRYIAFCLEHGLNPEDVPLYILTTGPIASRDAVEAFDRGNEGKSLSPEKYRPSLALTHCRAFSVA